LSPQVTIEEQSQQLPARGLVRQSFDHPNKHRWNELLKPVAPNVHHSFAGAHSIGDERHDREAMHRWPERVERQLSCNRYKAKSHCKSFDALAKLIKL